MKTPATWQLGRTPQRRNIRGGLSAVGRKSRCCSPISSRILRLTRLRLRGPNGANDEFLLAATAQNLETTRSLKTDRSASANPHRTGPRHIGPKPPMRTLPTLPETLPASYQTEYLTPFSTISANSGHCRRRGERAQIEPKERFGPEARTQDRRQRSVGRSRQGFRHTDARDIDDHGAARRTPPKRGRRRVAKPY